MYLRDYLGYSVSNAARMSSIFPGVGAVSVLATGWLSDRLGVNGRAADHVRGLERDRRGPARADDHALQLDAGRCCR